MNGNEQHAHDGMGWATGWIETGVGSVGTACSDPYVEKSVLSDYSEINTII